MIAGTENPWAEVYDPARKPLRKLSENTTAVRSVAQYLLPGEILCVTESDCSPPDRLRRGIAKARVQEAGQMTSDERLVPRTRSSHHNCRESGCELRVQSGTRIIELLVPFDSEVPKRACRKMMRTSESGH